MPTQSLKIPLRFPTDPALASGTYAALTQMLSVLQSLLGPTVPLPAPTGLTTVSVVGAVQLTWNEVPGAAAYAVYENPKAATYLGTLLQLVPANKNNATNAFTRLGLLDTNNRYYYVVPISPLGINGQPSVIRPGKALNPVILGSTLATVASAGTNGAVPAQVAGYVLITMGSAVFKIPLFNL